MELEVFGPRVVLFPLPVISPIIPNVSSLSLKSLAFYKVFVVVDLLLSIAAVYPLYVVGGLIRRDFPFPVSIIGGPFLVGCLITPSVLLYKLVKEASLETFKAHFTIYSLILACPITFYSSKLFKPYLSRELQGLFFMLLLASLTIIFYIISVRTMSPHPEQELTKG